MKITIRDIFLFIVGMSLAFISVAQDTTRPKKPVPGGGAVSIRELSAAAQNPTAPLVLAQLRDIIIPVVPGKNGAENLFQIQPVIPILPTAHLHFTQLIKITMQFPTIPPPEGNSGFGDFQLFDLVTIKQSWGRLGFGPALVFPTASSAALGQGKWQAGPAVAAIWTSIRHLVAGGVFQNPISYAGDATRPNVNTLIFTPSFTYNMEKGWFAGLSDFNWTLDWENNAAFTMPLGVQLGKVISIGSQPISMSFEGGYTIISPSGSNKGWVMGIEVTPIFKAF